MEQGQFAGRPDVNKKTRVRTLWSVPGFGGGEILVN